MDNSITGYKICELNKAGLLGRQSGTVPAFNYSDANKGAKVTWTEETFDEYITDPKKYIPGRFTSLFTKSTKGYSRD